MTIKQAVLSSFLCHALAPLPSLDLAFGYYALPIKKSKKTPFFPYNHRKEWRFFIPVSVSEVVLTLP
ncbi:hypothetical protein IPD43_13265 [Paenibacillus polymyxa]|uniref:hypothetical protein n=1 Tax=Paenibacillus polymyxa TaxID=1406 RepID=UPI0012B576F8|nr:hypothetical protein [Paenibacillus polymyxa]MBE7898612.1 hypothetical protein [Paenibacillus polymyxa]QPK53636.1 hypothetical protein G7035_13710 [Paenibacillus polymyxa]WEK66796.1 hypothetical protein ERJ71_21520 [Paenibacillus polymyxa]